MPLTLDQLFDSPDHYLHAFDGDAALFVPMDRAAYRRSIFLDQRISPAEGQVMRVSQGLLAQAPAACPTGWIFHMAHCGSTLLARALDALGGGLVLREPLALRQLALEPDRSALFAPTLALLSRRYPGSGATVIKANVPVNFMLDRISASDQNARAIFLYCRLPDYLCAILRSDNHRAWLRNVTGLLAAHFSGEIPQSDAELAALLWLEQMQRFDTAIAQMPHARSLEAEMFFACPTEGLVAACVLFGQAGEPTAIKALVAGPLFNSYSKNPAHKFDNAERLARRAALLVELRPEIAVAQHWLEENAPDAFALQGRIEAAAL